MHQWVYKDTEVRKMVLEPQDRSNIVRVATEAFGGTLHHFFFSFGEFDGMSISEFKDNETALSCLMSIFGEGRIQSVKTTILFTSQSAKSAMQRANAILR
jgi:uncharacterized protein with GYD domain